jgi:hypothetical protein
MQKDWPLVQGFLQPTVPRLTNRPAGPNRQARQCNTATIVNLPRLISRQRNESNTIGFGAELRIECEQPVYLKSKIIVALQKCEMDKPVLITSLLIVAYLNMEPGFSQTKNNFRSKAKDGFQLV